MKKSNFIILITVLFICMIINNNAFANKSRKDYFFKPQVGGWFGPISPVGSTGDLLKTNLGGGLFGRYNIPWKYFKVGVDISYQGYDSDGINSLIMVPMYASGIFLLPIPLPLKFQLKLGFGTTWIKAFPDRSQQWDPLFITGFEISFPAGRIVNIGLRIDYQYVIEKYTGAERGGHLINTGIQLYFNI
jgi:hypothetical protein